MRAPARRGRCTTAWRRTSPSGGTSSIKPAFRNNSAHTHFRTGSRSSSAQVTAKRHWKNRMADQPHLKIAIGTYGHTRALKWGDVRIEGVEPAFVEVVPIIGAFRRMVRDVEFDICEMAPTTYMIARALGAPY